TLACSLNTSFDFVLTFASAAGVPLRTNLFVLPFLTFALRCVVAAFFLLSMPVIPSVQVAFSLAGHLALTVSLSPFSTAGPIRLLEIRLSSFAADTPPAPLLPLPPPSPLVPLLPPPPPPSSPGLPPVPLGPVTTALSKLLDVSVSTPSTVDVVVEASIC